MRLSKAPLLGGVGGGLQDRSPEPEERSSDLKAQNSSRFNVQSSRFAFSKFRSTLLKDCTIACEDPDHRELHNDL